MSKDKSSSDKSILNINIGILGHVDSGKTSLVKALSTCLSTAALDKHPQSIERGITLDLGFSSFTLDLPDHLVSVVNGAYSNLQFTLVDCPGHASLLRTIIGGAQIIDTIILVIDVNKGIQAQTAECIVIGEITSENVIIALNKVDLLPETEREGKIMRMKRRIRKVFASTRFPDPPVVLLAAAVGGERVAAATQTKGEPVVQSSGIEDLVHLLRSTVQLPRRVVSGPFLFAVDHCFAIKGHGTVVTGTVLAGSVATSNTIEFPDLKLQRKVKSMQMFRRTVKVAMQGDRVGLCVTNLE